MVTKSIFRLAAVALIGAGAFATAELRPAMAEKTLEVGGAAMYPSKNIIENAMNSKDHTTLVAAVKAAGLVDTLSGEGPFTVFAPTNAAFDKLPKGTVENLMKPENKEKLKQILTYHVIGGKAPTSAAITQMTKDDDNAHPVKMVSGDKLTTMIDDGKLKIKDASGNVATVTIADVKQSNGVIHVIDTVLLPKS